MKTVLVVGATGFIGVHLANQLQSNGYMVTVMDKALNNYTKLHPDINFILADLRSVSFSDKSYDCIYHLAGTEEKDLYAHAEEYISTSIWGSYKLIHEFPTTRTVFASCHNTINSKSIYAVAKRGAEHVINLHSNSVSLKFWNVFGEYEHRDTDFVCVVSKSLKSMQTVYIEEGKRDYTYVKDLVIEMIRIAESNIKGSASIGYGDPVSSEELYKTIAKIAKKKTNYKTFPYKKELENPIVKYKIKEPKYGLYTGLRNTVKYYMTNNNF